MSEERNFLERNIMREKVKQTRKWVYLWLTTVIVALSIFLVCIPFTLAFPFVLAVEIYCLFMAWYSFIQLAEAHLENLEATRNLWYAYNE